MLKKIITVSIFLFVLISSNLGQDELKQSTYIADNSISSVSWLCGQHYGCVSLDTGYLNVVDNKILDGKFVIDLISLFDEDIEHELLRLTLANVIKSHEFFDVPNFRYATFTILQLEEVEINEYHITGELTLKDKTLPIDFDCEINIINDLISVYSSYIGIDRTKWGINYLSKKFDPDDKEQMHVPDKIEFLIQLKAKKLIKKHEKK